MQPVPQVVPRTYAASYCDAFAAELSEDEKYRIQHIHRCTGLHRDYHGLKTHTCTCQATFYFVEEALELIIQRLNRVEAQHEVTPLGADVRSCIDGVTESNPRPGGQQ